MLVAPITKENAHEMGKRGAAKRTENLLILKAQAAKVPDLEKALEELRQIGKPDEMGEEPLNMVANFRCLNGENFNEEIGICLFGGKLTEETTMVENALAWFALEESCRMFEE